jgi:hypothetical protein
MILSKYFPLPPQGVLTDDALVLLDPVVLRSRSLTKMGNAETVQDADMHYLFRKREEK